MFTKRLLAGILAALMCFALVSCTDPDAGTETTESTTQSSSSESTSSSSEKPNAPEAPEGFTALTLSDDIEKDKVKIHAE